jgi:hypothetical protein
VLEVLGKLMSVHGQPQYLRSENGPEFVAPQVKDWIKKIGVQRAYIEGGKPWKMECAIAPLSPLQASPICRLDEWNSFEVKC